MSDTTYALVSGRWIWGDLFTPTDKGYQGKPLQDSNGDPYSEIVIGLAVTKADWAQIAPTVQQVAQVGFPNGEWQRPDFSWKVEDADGVKATTQLPSRYAQLAPGCVVLTLRTRLVETFSVYDNAPKPNVLTKGMAQKGCYLQVSVGLKANGNLQKPGVYLNLGPTRVIGYGEVIQGGPDPETVFGGAPAALPAGASATPVAPSTGMPGTPPQQPAAPAQGAMPGLPGAAVAPAAAPAQAPPAAAGIPGAVPAQPGQVVTAQPGVLVPGGGIPGGDEIPF